jgi:hypothetical protein
MWASLESKAMTEYDTQRHRENEGFASARSRELKPPLYVSLVERRLQPCARI